MLNKAGYEDRQLYRCQEFLLTYLIAKCFGNRPRTVRFEAETGLSEFYLSENRIFRASARMDYFNALSMA